MSFWDKKGEKNNIDDEALSSSDLLDVSNLNIPDSDNNDQYGEDVLAKTFQTPTFPAFLDNARKAMDIPKSSSSKTQNFMAPPIPKTPLSETTFQDDVTKEELPPLPLDDEAEELPPLPLDDEEEELPPLALDDEEEELPPLPLDDEDEELPPLPLDDEAEELPPLALDDEEEELPPLPLDDEEEELPPLALDDEAEELPPLPLDDEDEELSPLPLDDEDEELPALPLDDEEEELPPLALDDEEEGGEIESEDLSSPQAYIENNDNNNSDNKAEKKVSAVKNQSTSKNTISDTPIETEEDKKPLAQAPRSNTFEKHEEFVIDNPSDKEDENQKDSAENTPEQNGELNEVIHHSNPLFLRKLFSNGNTCITAPGATFQLKEDLRSLLALFSNGRYFVAETYKYDGKVLSFEYLVKKRNLQIGKPEYVPMSVLNTIYEYAAQNTYTEDEEEEVEKADVVEQAQARMQRDFITIVSRAAAMHVSDIHVVVADNTIVMFRVNGLMQTEMEYKKEWGESFVRAAFASADISDANYAQNEYQAAQKLGRTPLRGSHGKLVLPKNILGIRLQFNPIAFGTRYVVLRLLYAEENMETTSALEALGFTKKDTDDFYKLRGSPTGITIISGPTGSGKSTTLQRNMIAMLQERNYEVNLITVEDPPEYPIPGARQMPVTNATIEEAKEREFTKALAAALRSDPDSMMIGEIRTLSAADLAFRAALSGHNVWTTLHANNAPSILIRLKDMGVEEFKLKDPEIIQGLTAQRLFRRLCPHCRIPTMNMLKSPIVQRLREGFGDIALETTYLRGAGCKQCDFKGVKGRIAVSEIILPDATFLDLMMKGETIKATNYWINELNGTTLRESALRHMFNGIIDVGEVERWTGFLNQTITS